MALQLDTIRATAQRVAASHDLDLVDIEFQGGGKFRTLRIYIEKNAVERAKLAETANPEELPKGVPVEMLSGVTHEDCARFAQDFSTVLDVEELIPGAEYTLEVSSPGLDRKLHGREDYARFAGSLAKLRTIEPIQGNCHWQGRIGNVTQDTLDLDLSTASKKKNKAGTATDNSVTLAFSNILKANLVPEI